MSALSFRKFSSIGKVNKLSVKSELIKQPSTHELAEKGYIYQVIDTQTGKAPANLILRRKGKSLLVVVDNQVVLELDNFYAESETADKPAYLINERCLEGETFNPDELQPADLINANSEALKQDGDEMGLVWEACQAGESSVTGELASALGVTESQLLWGALGLLGAGAIGAGIGGFGGGKKADTPTPAPKAPTVQLDPNSDTGISNTDNLTNDPTPTLTGQGAPGDTITIKDPNGNVIATTIVQANGNWSATPANPLPNGPINLSVTETNSAGKTSPATPISLVIDAIEPDHPSIAVSASIAVPEGQLVNANEAADGTPIVTTLPSDAVVGDTLTTVVTKPDGTTLTLTYVLTAGDITAGTVSQLINASELTAVNNGVWTTSTTLTDAAGNVSLPETNGFTLDTLAPSLPTVAVPEGLLVNANEAADGTPIVTTLPSDVVVGDTLTTVVTKPDGTTLTLTYVLTAPDITAGSVSQLINASELTAANNGVWITSTTLTDAAGNVSLPDSNGFTLNTLVPSLTVAVPEGQLVNANEAADGTPIVTTLSSDAVVGDTLTTVVTKPDGTKLTLTYVLTAADITAGTVSQLINASELTAANNGDWTTSTTLTDAAGNVSLPETNGFTLDTLAPSLPTVAVPEGQLVNANEAADGTPIVTTLPSDAVVGDTLTTVVTKPDGTTLTLTYVLTAADITAGTVSQLINASELTAASNGDWTTSTTLTDAAGNVSLPDTKGFTLDTKITQIQIPDPSNPPLTGGYPTVGLDPNSDSGDIGDDITNVTKPTISGANATPGDTITIYDVNNNVVAIATVAPDGTWSATPTTDLPFGVNNLSIVASDAAGNLSNAIPLVLEITKDLVIEGSLTLGEVKFGQVMVYAYDDQGNELGHDLIDKPETSDLTTNGFTGFHIEVANKGNYHGAILIKVVDVDSVDVNYQDEVTGTDKSLNTIFRAVAFADSSNSQYSDSLDPSYNSYFTIDRVSRSSSRYYH